jgi:guanyl-specific ribonuclease Sa
MLKSGLLAAACALLLPVAAAAQSQSRPGSAEIAIAALPGEARDTLALIRKGGPYPYRQDGVIFRNRERLLAQKPRDYYREYTVKTPGSRDRGARRIVAGGTPPAEFFYTDDHYRSFRRIRE